MMINIAEAYWCYARALTKCLNKPTTPYISIAKLLTHPANKLNIKLASGRPFQDLSMEKVV